MYGVTGSGKTTLARQIGEIKGLPWHSVDDEIGWLPGWVERPRDDQRDLASRIASSEEWVLDTAYRHWLDVVLPQTQLIVALDYPRLVSLARLLRRTAKRVVGRELVCNGNRGVTPPGALLPIDRGMALPQLLTEASTYRRVAGGRVRSSRRPTRSSRMAKEWLAALGEHHSVVS